MAGLGGLPCSLSYSGGENRENQVSQPAQAKSLQDPSQPIKAGQGACACHFSSVGRSQFRQDQT